MNEAETRAEYIDPKKTPESTDSPDNHMAYFSDTEELDEISLFRKSQAKIIKQH